MEGPPSHGTRAEQVWDRAAWLGKCMCRDDIWKTTKVTGSMGHFWGTGAYQTGWEGDFSLIPFNFALHE
jgi:hypothetical protein